MKITTLKKSIAATLFAAALPAHANLITNGSFEQGSYTGDPATFQTLGFGSNALTGWVVNTGEIDWIKGYWQAADGAYSLDLSGTGAGSIAASTSFNTTLGQLYRLSFALSGNPDNGGGIRNLGVLIAGAPVSTFLPYSYNTVAQGTTRSNMQWQTVTYEFLGSGNATTLTFSSGNSSAYGPALDNVVVTAVPEPATLALLGLGLAGLGFVRRRKV